MECPVFNQLPQKFNFYRPIGFPTSRFLAFRTKCDKYLLPLKKLGDLLGVAKIHTVLLHHVLQEGQPVPGVGFGYCYFKSEMATGWMHVTDVNWLIKLQYRVKNPKDQFFCFEFFKGSYWVKHVFCSSISFFQNWRQIRVLIYEILQAHFPSTFPRSPPTPRRDQC